MGHAAQLVPPMLNASHAVEVFAYSYRGYPPNGGRLRAAERPLVEDSCALYAFAAAAHGGRSPGASLSLSTNLH
jgi:hypothetical protein